MDNLLNQNDKLNPKEAIELGKQLASKWLEVEEDDISKLKAMCVQYACNLDYDSGFNVTGIIEHSTRDALRDKYVKLGDVQWLCTAVELLLLLNGYNPHGVEFPGTIGSQCVHAIKEFQGYNRLTLDGIAGYGTITTLL